MQVIKRLHLIVMLFLAIQLGAQNYDGQTLVSKATYLGKSKPLSQIAKKPQLDREKVAALKANHPKKFFPNFKGKTPTVAVNKDAKPQGPDPVWQRSFAKNGAQCILPLVNREGIGEATGGATPPDPTGAIGKDYYIQSVNSTFFQIFNKEGGAVTAPTSMQPFWQQFGKGSGGDPIILYDQDAERWLFSEFPPGQNFLLVAYSETSDPMGAWNAYQFNTPSFPDYPKYSLWDNAIVVTTNEGGDIPVYAMQRDSMLAGASDVSIARMTVPRISTGPSFQVITPVNWSGPMAPSESLDPMIIRMVDDAWGTVTEDQLEIWSIDVDWENPSAASINKTSSIITAPYDSYPCSAETGGFACVPQPNASEGVDSQVEIIMHQVHYRRFAQHESIVLNFIVDATGGDNHSGIRWFELRKTDATDWDVHQEGTYAPDALHRYMGGIAIDGAGNIGLGLSLSDSQTFPSLAFTGRRNSDTPGQMTIQEHRIVTGGGNTNSFARYGDYAQLTVDPIDQRTFWYTGEYMISNGNWGTKIFSFQLQDSVDLLVDAMASPLSSSSLAMIEDIIIDFQNIGIDSVENYDLSYSVNGGAFVKESFNTTFHSGVRMQHTFATPAVLDGTGPYEIRCVIHTEGDDNPLNDTLTVNLKRLLLRDVGVVSVEAVEDPVCKNETTINIEISNYSDIPLTATRVYIENNGELIDSIDWTGDLALGEKTTISHFVTDLQAGIQSLRVFTSMPNGLEDLNPLNDDQSTSFEVIGNGAGITLNLQLDQYPGETSWTLFDDAGVEIISGDEYNNRELLEIEFCLDPSACYTFTIYDSFGDGLNGQFGNNQGYYNIVDESGVILVQMEQVNFGDDASHNFCAEFVCMMTADISTAPTFATSDDGIIMIDVMDGISPFQYSIDGGSTFQDNNIFTGLPSGTYSVIVVDANDCTYMEEIEIAVCDMQVLVEATSATGPNETDGSIMFTLTGGQAPFQYSIDGGQTFLSENEFNNLLPGLYDVVVLDALGCEWSLDDFGVDFEVSGTNNTNIAGASIKVFPNPTNGLFKIEVRESKLSNPSLDLEILDMQGKIIGRSELHRYNDFYAGQISILTAPSGTYLIRFLQEELNTLVKLIKE